MRMEALLPRALSPESGSDCASLLGSLLTGIHLDRSLARSLGWRGVRPSAEADAAWSFRVAGSDNIFGLLFLGETVSSSRRSLCGEFAVFVFPKHDSPLLDLFPLEALRQALREDYAVLVRDFSLHTEALAPFQSGRFRLEALLDGSGLGLCLEAAARRRITALDGVTVQNPDGQRIRLVEPGGLECDVPEYRLLLPAFSLLTVTAERLLQQKADVFLAASPVASFGFRTGGERERLPGKHDHLVRLQANFGASELQNGQARRLAHVPGRGRSCESKTSRLPVLHILTGFLGSGKTTFLRRWLDFLHGRERFTGVIQNEFGASGLDARLIGEEPRVEAIDDGCVCCSLAQRLRPGLERLLADMPAEQFILETTGLANPENVLQSLRELDDLVVPGLVVTVLDALDLCQRPLALEETGVLRAQVEGADVLVINTTDIVERDVLPGVLERVAEVNGRALLLTARHGAIGFARLDAFHNALLDHPGATRMPSRYPILRHWSQNSPTHATEGYTSRTLTWDRPITRDEIQAVLTACGPGLRRAKGVVCICDEGLRMVQYAAGRLCFDPPPAECDDEEGNGFVVLIGTELNLHTPG